MANHSEDMLLRFEELSNQIKDTCKSSPEYEEALKIYQTLKNVHGQLQQSERKLFIDSIQNLVKLQHAQSI